MSWNGRNCSPMAEYPPEALDNPHDLGLKPSPLPRIVQTLGIALFCLALLATAGYAVTEHWRRATFILGGAMVWLAILRLSCDSKVLGLLSVRSRGSTPASVACLAGGCSLCPPRCMRWEADSWFQNGGSLR